MRKSIFFAIVSVFGFVQFDSFAAVATRGNVRGANDSGTTESSTQSAPVAARAAVRSAARTTNNAATVTQSGAVSARAGARQKVVNNNVNAAQPAATAAVTARAGAKQKVINTGTKVESATENTAVPQECQDAFYGCMDAFCMLDNASGGRCQCNDRITELDAALDDILKLDEQTYIMATEGVERIQMGEAEDQVMARAKAVADKAVEANKSEDNKKKVRNLDLSLWDNSIFNEAEDLFDSLDVNSSDGLSDKKGTALYKAAAKMCANQVPAQCKSYDSMLQLVYAQKIKSDCAAYENSLKAQKSQSQQKLQAAQQALREAALDEYKNQNKYATTGECVIAFTQCMQTTAECGDDYTGCVTLAAAENVRTNKSVTVAKQTTIKSTVKGADIKLAASTIDQLLAKKTICESVTKQCVNANKNDAVWNAFLHNAAPALKSAELVAEQNLRSNCLPSITKCFSDACKSNFGDGDSYDACLSSPETYMSLCKVQIEPCLEATGGTLEHPENSTLWDGVKAMLNAMKVDACTNEIKTCLTDRCGDDYSGCIGLSTTSIINICPKDKLTACRNTKDNKNKTVDMDDYIVQIAQGLMIQIDNSLLTACQSAANEAMIKVCGDTESCDASMAMAGLADTLGYQICEVNNNQSCVADVSMISSSTQYIPKITGKVDWSKITFENPVVKTVTASTATVSTATVSGGKPLVINGRQFTSADIDNSASVTISSLTSGENKSIFKSTDDDNTATVNTVKALNNSLDSIMANIESDPKVIYCKTGRKVQGFKRENEDGNIDDSDSKRFPNLTDSMRSVVADAIYESAVQNYNAKLEELQEKSMEDMKSVLASGYKEKELDEANEDICLGKKVLGDFAQRGGHKSTYTEIPTYKEDTNICVLLVENFECRDYIKGRGCSTVRADCNSGSEKRAPGSWCLSSTRTKTIQMPKSTD